MLRLAEYQQELVHIYGPAVRDILLDVFFDDGSDPVIELLKGEQLELREDRRGRARTEAPYSERELFDAWNDARASHLQRRGEDGMASRVSVPSGGDAHDEDAAVAALSRKREVLNRALDYCRNTKKCAY
ncbi:hypothetical protein STCU_10862 [Strigomonas culicis]|uniref:Uncharacterized protein n=1 Tax=Strigomonas culicis TaxID=28005 RepID=S9TL18_9TRYP|nr:hypothetical protein STCU_10862 [Strigomonas culicis]|eukprot:EPY17018.1 hypothetical protein STCU_10862 [Strigomonas culicis]